MAPAYFPLFLYHLIVPHGAEVMSYHTVLFILCHYFTIPGPHICCLIVCLENFCLYIETWSKVCYLVKLPRLIPRSFPHVSLLEHLPFLSVLFFLTLQNVQGLTYFLCLSPGISHFFTFWFLLLEKGVISQCLGAQMCSLLLEYHYF